MRLCAHPPLPNSHLVIGRQPGENPSVHDASCAPAIDHSRREPQGGTVDSHSHPRIDSSGLTSCGRHRGLAGTKRAPAINGRNDGSMHGRSQHGTGTRRRTRTSISVRGHATTKHDLRRDDVRRDQWIDVKSSVVIGCGTTQRLPKGWKLRYRVASQLTSRFRSRYDCRNQTQTKALSLNEEVPTQEMLDLSNRGFDAEGRC